MTHRTRSNRSRRRGSARLAVVLVGVGVVAAVAALAVPRMMAGGSEESSALVPAPAAPEPDRAAPDEPASEPAEAPHETAKAGRASPSVPVSEKGDLELSLTLRWPSVRPGTTAPATVRFVNAGLKPFHLPAPGEASPSLSIVLLDAEGDEVRRIVETGPDAFPRRTRLVPSGGSMELPVQIVGVDDAPLAPGAYTVYAELKRDPTWVRLGLPMWTAPNGPVRSRQEPFTIAE